MWHMMICSMDVKDRDVLVSRAWHGCMGDLRWLWERSKMREKRIGM